MALIQCWDDGVVSDARLAEILRRHGAKASFNLNAGLHEKHRRRDWIYRGNEVWKLGRDELRDVYAGFAIANHGLTHRHLETLPLAEAQREIDEGRDRLQQLFAQPVLGFAYPYGTYNDDVIALLRAAGHVYARTVGNAAHPFPPAEPLTLASSCHFLAPDFWARYEAARAGGVFYFWGHSYELIGEAMWADFDEAIARMSNDPMARWCDIAELVAAAVDKPR